MSFINHDLVGISCEFNIAKLVASDNFHLVLQLVRHRLQINDPIEVAFAQKLTDFLINDRIVIYVIFGHIRDPIFPTEFINEDLRVEFSAKFVALEDWVADTSLNFLCFVIE